MNSTITPLSMETRERIIKRMQREHDFTYEKASAILDETLVYMHACERDTTGIGPSLIVDIGWHTFILYTREYAEYCAVAFGHFLHHDPTDREGDVGLPLSGTIAFMEQHGITYDPQLWKGAAECGSGPYCGNRCSRN